jgi:hypothetical protein
MAPALERIFNPLQRDQGIDPIESPQASNGSCRAWRILLGDRKAGSSASKRHAEQRPVHQAVAARERLSVNVRGATIRTGNVAAVMVAASLSPSRMRAREPLVNQKPDSLPRMSAGFTKP